MPSSPETTPPAIRASAARETLAPQAIARMRQQYLDGVAVAQILTEHGVSKATLYRWLDGGWSGDRQWPPIPRRRAVAASPPTIRGSKALIARLWRNASLQVDEIGQRLAHAGLSSRSTQGDARTLAVLVKTLRELVALNERRTRPAKADTSNRADDEDDFIPQDLDELRRELARRVDLIRQRRNAARGAGGDAG